ncbi:MAG: DUF3305 domain-containing protein [Roseinatronobacter sp.]
MVQKILRVGVVATRRPPVTRWGAGELRPTAILPAEPDLQAPYRLSEQDGVETWFLGARDVVLHQGDTGHHQDNLQSGRPALWVALRGQDPMRAELVCVTADPYEGEGLVADLDLKVEAVPMPEPLQEAVADFVARYHIEIEFKKRKRLPADPNALVARAPRILQPEEKWGASRPRKE